MKKQLLILLMLLAIITPLMATPVNDHHIAEQVNGSETDTTALLTRLLTWYDAHMNYGAVTAFMTLESSFIPFPSEVVIPPAVYVACNPDTQGGMKIWLIVLFGTLGALLGAFINYFLSRWLGRPIIYAFADSRVGHLLRLSKEKVQQAETYFNQHGSVSTLVGRFIPVIRQLISIPAGLAKMNLLSFSFFTFLGAALWNVVLAFLGYLAYQAADPDIINKYSHQISVIIIVLFCALVAFFIIRAIVKKHKTSHAGAES